MKSYQRMLDHIIINGEYKPNRTGVDSYAVFGYQWRHSLKDGFPLLTTKKVFFKAVAHELIWFLQGSGNIDYLRTHGITIWDAWADEDGNLGPVYGTQWRHWWGQNLGGKPIYVDQIKTVIATIKIDPFSRRHIVTAWNPAEVDAMALPPCHCFFQFHVNRYKELSCHVYMRSADAFLGVPFNIASYALLTHMVAQVTGLKVNDLVFSFGDLHVYVNHMEQISLQLSRHPRPLPELRLNTQIDDIDKFGYEDIDIVGYNPMPAIKGEVAI